ncbi:hypothetical protein GCM10009547_22670 [Sporichthya brevicatena]|uniref:Sulfotransferase family protein n=1 Tax=Sporichthya brevicatena TaxID=171442 RepID=A0ABN1GU44_9ACTN
MVVVGAAKSGTSALFSAIRSQGDWLAIYEANHQGQIQFLTTHPAPRRVTKVLQSRIVERGLDLTGFDHRIHLVRDPRDMLISWILFRPLIGAAARDPEFVSEFCGALRRKEADPRSVSLADLEEIYRRHDVGRPFAERFSRAFADEAAVCERYPDMHRIRYEDFLASDVDDLARRIGVPIRTEVTVGDHIAHNERSKTAGGWRHWFTPVDVDAYRPLFDPALQRHGYDLDWTLATEPTIDPATGSGYVERNLTRPRLVGAGRPEMLARDRYTPERIEMLNSGVADGREAAMVELALVHLRGVNGPRDFAAARELLEDAAARGNGYAMIHLGLAARYRAPGFGKASGRYFRQAVEVMGRQRATRQIGEFDRGWREHVLPAGAAGRSQRWLLRGPWSRVLRTFAITG